jgi:hypothetical protein
MIRRTLVLASVVVLLAGVGGSCSADEADFGQTATELVEGQLADELGLGALTASCDEPGSTDVGTAFDCTATTEAGDEIRLQAEITEKDEVFVSTLNVLTAESLPGIETEAARILAEQVGIDLPAENIDCGDQSILAEPGQPFTCAVTEPDTGDVYDLSITLDDFENPNELQVEVAQTPRP